MGGESIEKIWGIIASGGPVMIALLALAILLYWNAITLLIFVARLKITDTLQKQAGAEFDSREAIVEFKEKFDNVVTSQRKFVNVLIIAAPLLGLLGTVIGMLDTFKGIGTTASEDTTKAVADGVKVALITTQTGLSIAIVGIITGTIIAWVYRRRELELVEMELESMKQSIEA